MAIANNDVIRTTMDGRYLGVNVVQNVYHWRYTGTAVVDDQIAVDDVKDQLELSVYTVLDVDITLDISFVNYENFNVTQHLPLPDSIPVGVFTGLDIANTLPLQVGPLISFPTLVARSIGRKYFFGYTERTTPGGGIITAASVAILGAAGVNLLIPFVVEAGVGEWGNTNIDGTTFNKWISYRVDTLHRTQRRRVPGVGV